MKKNGALIMFSTMILALVTFIPGVQAGVGIPATKSGSTPIAGLNGIYFSEHGTEDGQEGNVHTRKYNLKINGKVYDGFCIDPGSPSPDPQLECSLIEDEGLKYIFAQRKAGVPDAIISTALRLYSSSIGIATSALNGEKAAWVRMHQTDQGATLVVNGTTLSRNPWDYVYDKSFGKGVAPSSGVLKEAYELYRRALPMTTIGAETTSSSIKFTDKVYKGEVAEHHIVSTSPIDKSEIEPECENCTIVNFDWSGTSGVITVSAPCNQDYKVGLSSMEAGVYACNDSHKNTQTLLMLAEEDTEAKLWDDGKIPCDGEGCCTTGTEIKPGHIEGSVNNCCEDGGNSEAHEYNLDDLFCRDDTLYVDYYYPKCKTDYYIQEDADLNEKYCQMYCTERVSVEIPGSITATSGRYFELTTTSKGTKSPYIEGFKRCRVRVQYDVWENDYRDLVDQQVISYNTFQENEAKRQTYEDAVKNKREKQTSQGAVTLKFSASCYEKKEPSCPTCGDGCEADYSNSKTIDTTVIYDYYPFSKFLDWYSVELDIDKRNRFQAYEIKKSSKAGRTSAKYSDNWSADNFDYTNVENAKSTIVGKTHTETNGRCSCVATWKFDGYEPSNAEKHSEKVEAALATYTQNASTAMSSYNSAINQAKQLEKDLDKCDYYFSPSGGLLGGPYKGANAKENYDFDATASFSYTQVYMDNDKGLQLDEQYISFKDTPGCVITGPTLGPDAVDNLKEKRYSKGRIGEYGDEELLHDFGKELSLGVLQKNEGDYENYLDKEYKADKVFTHDAKYRAECSWDEDDNVYYTLTPNGAASETTDFINFTEHGQEYRLHLSTLDGTYETYWRVSGLGSRQKGTSKGKFDDFFKEQGTTCANESPSETSMFTCKIHVEYEIVLTGYCNGSNGSDTTVDPADCDPYKEGYNLFTFKVVDPSNIFPNGYSTSAGDVGYNWSSTDAGKQAKNEIESRGKADKTYSQEFLTYSFILSPTDMGHIKNYNVEANFGGGYSDFKMDCNCSGGSCVNCKSRFLNELANGNVTYDGTSHSVTGWSNKQTNLDGIRRKYGW